jgi:hypothetical protein
VKRQGRELAGTLEFWFRRKFNLPPNDPRFLEMTDEGMAVEFWAHHYAEKPPAEEIEDDDLDVDQVLADIERNPDGWEDVK